MYENNKNRLPASNESEVVIINLREPNRYWKPT